MIHVALVSAYPTEAAARAGIAEELHIVALGEFRGSKYLGVWHTPEPAPAAVHVFGEVDPARLRLAGWTPDCARTEPHTCGTDPEERA